MTILQDTTGILILGIALMCVAVTSALRGLVARAAAHEAARRKGGAHPVTAQVLPMGAPAAAKRRAA